MKSIILLLLSVSTASAVTVTAYCPCKVCCGPNAQGITASGKPARQGVTIAASRKIPFGTKILIPGVGVRIVQDRLAKRFDNRIDLFFNSHAEAKKFGIKELDVVLEAR